MFIYIQFVVLINIDKYAFVYKEYRLDSQINASEIFLCLGQNENSWKSGRVNRPFIIMLLYLSKKSFTIMTWSTLTNNNSNNNKLKGHSREAKSCKKELFILPKVLGFSISFLYHMTSYKKQKAYNWILNNFSLISISILIPWKKVINPYPTIAGWNKHISINSTEVGFF